MSNVMQFKMAMEEYGLLPKSVNDNGRWNRCATTDKPKKRNGAYIFDGESGSFINLATMSQHVFWRSDKPLSAEDKAKYVRDCKARELREKQAKERAIKGVREYFAGLEPLRSAHPYLTELKGLTMAGCAGVRRDGDLMVIPAWRNGQLMTVQTIAADGVKRFRSGCPKQGACFVIERKDATITAFVEGFATGLAVFQSVPNVRVVVCFDAGNLVEVAGSFKARGLALICADNDHAGVVNKGVESGKKAAGLLRCGLVYPMDILGSDFDDALREWGVSGASRIRDLVMRNAVMVF